jgi:hypothetical protein
MFYNPYTTAMKNIATGAALTLAFTLYHQMSTNRIRFITETHKEIETQWNKERLDLLSQLDHEKNRLAPKKKGWFWF